MMYPSFSRHYAIPTLKFMTSGVFDPILTSDTKLFIDPLLLQSSAAPEISDQASDLFQDHFSNVFKLMAKSSAVDDVAWIAAKKLLQYKEIKFTCIGYGSKSIRGSSLSEEKQGRMLSIAKQIAEIGMADPYLLPLLSLIEDGIGPDQISDMTTNIIHPAICQYTKRVCDDFGVPTQEIMLKGRTYELPVNPFENDLAPVLLLPMDILKVLPVVSGWEDIGAVSSHNRALRDQLNERLGFLFKDVALTERQKEEARRAILGDKTLLELLSATLKARSKDPYDFGSDVEGHLIFQRLVNELPDKYEFKHEFSGDEEPIQVVSRIVEQYRHLIEKQDLWQELWAKSRFKNETAMQRLFFVVASSYCDANNLDVSPEPDSGSGRIDFKFSRGAETKIIVEIKKANNSKLQQSLESQLCKYCEGEKASHGLYVVLDPGYESTTWYENLEKRAQELKVKYSIGLTIEPVDAARRTSPSKGNERIPYRSGT
ncbi:MAG: hypothetical protein AAFR51_13755 [Pseudomonadota bacterium]